MLFCVRFLCRAEHAHYRGSKDAVPCRADQSEGCSIAPMFSYAEPGVPEAWRAVSTAAQLVERDQLRPELSGEVV